MKEAGSAEKKRGGTELKVLSGWRAFIPRLRLRLHVGRCALRKQRFPLAFLSAARGGLISTEQLRKNLKLEKVVRFGGRYAFALNLPLFPSRAFDSMIAGGGLNLAAAGTRFKQQIDVAILAITQRCTLACKHCYERFNLADEDSVSIGKWKEVVAELQELGTSVITFSGGEPMLRFEDLLGLLGAGDKDLSDFHVHTSGYGVTRDKALALRTAGLAAAGVGLDDVDPARHDAFRGQGGAYEQAVRSLGHFRDAGIFPYVNTCLTEDLVRSGRLADYLRFARDRQIGFVRWLEPKPCGGYFPRRPEDLFSEDARRRTTTLCLEANTKKEWESVPPVSYLAHEESPKLLGCRMGGLMHFYIDSRGNVEPCVFLPVSFGNIRKEKLSVIIARMRAAIPSPIRKGCPAALLYNPIKTAHERNGAYPARFEDIRSAWETMLGPTRGVRCP